MKLRPYQNEIISDTRLSMRQGCKKNLIVSPTGSGKTALTAEMLKTASRKGKRCWFIVHRRELIKQSVKAFDLVGIRHGIISASFPVEHQAPVQICSIQTLARRYKNIPPPDMIVWDEAHHCGAKTYSDIHAHFSNKFHIGLTATPERLDGKGLNKYFSHMIQGPSTEELIELGWLSPYKMFAPNQLDTSKLHTRMGDYIKSEMNELVDKPVITGSAIGEYNKLAPGARAVVFCIGVKHSQHVVSEFNRRGIKAAHVDGETPRSERDRAIEQFAAGKIKVLCNVDLFGEGFDLPAIEVAILLRPTQSLALYLQQVGRSLRLYEGKKQAIILDHVGNCMRHGLPDDVREWSLEGKEGRLRGSKNGEPSIRNCPQCFAVQVSSKPVCNYCGHVFESQARSIEEVEGELQEVDPAVVRRQRMEEQSYAHTMAQLTALGIKRGYKRPHMWAKHVMQARQRKKLR